MRTISKHILLVLLFNFLVGRGLVVFGYEVVTAINSGGVKHTDADGIEYSADVNFIGGIRSTWDSSMFMRNVPEADRPLYQSVRYAWSEFGYNIPIAGDGKYALILKMANTDNKGVNESLFNVTMNERLVVSRLDLYAKALNAVYDVYAYFDVCDGGQTLIYNGQSTTIVVDTLRLSFKSVLNKANVDAIVLMKGDPDEVVNLKSSPSSPVRFQQFDGCVSSPGTTTTSASVAPTTSPSVATTTSSSVAPTTSETPSTEPTTETTPSTPIIPPGVGFAWDKLFLAISSIKYSNNTNINVNVYNFFSNATTNFQRTN